MHNSHNKLSTNLILGFTFFCIYEGQKKIDFGSKYRLPGTVQYTDWLTHSLAVLVTQDTIYWFKKMPRKSSGSLLVGVWILGCLFINMSFTTNLRVKWIQCLFYTGSNIWKFFSGLFDCCRVWKTDSHEQRLDRPGYHSYTTKRINTMGKFKNISDI